MKNTAFRDGLDAAGEKITRRAALDRATMMSVEDADAYLAGYDAGLRKPKQVKLLINVDAEGVHIPAGTLCEVETYYPPTGEGRFGEHGCYDLKAGEVLFWVNEDEVKRENS